MARARLGAVLIVLAVVAGCAAAPEPPSSTPTPAQDPATQPYPPGQFTVAHPKRTTGVDLCAPITPQELTLLLGANAHFENPTDGTCILVGERGQVFVIFHPYNVDTASTRNEPQAHRETIGGNSAWVSSGTPSYPGCDITIATEPKSTRVSMNIGGNGTFTCDRLRHIAELVLDSLPPTP